MLKQSIGAALFALTLFVQPAAFAQTEPASSNCLLSNKDKPENENQCVAASDLLGSIDLATPDNALFTLMGATPEAVIRPKAGDKLMLSMLPQATDALGNDQYAFAFEVNPSLFMLPTQFTAAELQGKNQGVAGSSERLQQLAEARAWAPFTISAVASKTTEGSETQKLGLGINYIYDTGSPFLRPKAYAECIEGRQAPLVQTSDQYMVRLRIIQDRIESENPNDRDPEGTAEKELQASDWFKNEYVKSVKTVVDACVAEAAPWNRDVYAFGVAAYNSSIQETSATPAPGQSLPKENETGFGVWASASLQGPIFRKSKSSQLTLHARYTENMVRDRKVGSNTVTETVDGWQVGARYTQRLAGIDGGDQQFRLFIEGAYVEEKFGAIDDEFAQAGIGFEVQIQKDLFFQAVIGDTFDSDIDRGNYLSGQLKWSFSKGPAH